MTKDDSGDNLLDHARCEIFLVHPDVADGVASEIPSPGSLVKCPILAQLLAVSLQCSLHGRIKCAQKSKPVSLSQ
jgi:hypothetical protein